MAFRKIMSEDKLELDVRKVHAEEQQTGPKPTVFEPHDFGDACDLFEVYLVCRFTCIMVHFSALVRHSIVDKTWLFAVSAHVQVISCNMHNTRNFHCIANFFETKEKAPARDARHRRPTGKIIGGNENGTPLVSVNMFITCMNALMSLQSLILCEGFTASLTRKGSFARMNQLKERNANK